MSPERDAGAGTSPGTRERVAPYAAVALLLAVAGILAAFVRPLAPPLPPGSPDLATFAPDVLEVVEAYRGPRRAGVVLATLVTLAVPLLVLLTAAGRRVVARVVGDADRAPLRGGLVAAGLVALIDVVTFPLALWIGFVHETRWGFRTSTFSGWMRDWVVGRAPGWLLAAAAVAALLWAIARWPRSWHWRAAVAGAVASAVLVVASPLVLEPLMLRTAPLEDGPALAAVDDVLVRAGFGEIPVVVGDASRRTRKVNAYVSGLGPSRRVVLYDTLVALPPESVAAVLAHEIAHDLHRDIERGVLLGATGLVAALVLLRLVLGSGRVRRLVDARGPTDPRLVPAGAALLAVLWAVSLPVVSHVSRTLEAAADHGAVVLTADPAAQVRLRRAFVVRDLSDPVPPAWQRLVFSSHPPATERIRAAVAYAEEVGATLPTVAELEDEEAPIRHPRLP